MKRSQAVRLTLVASASSATVGGAAACSRADAPADALHCVQRGTNRVVADSLCDRARAATNGGRTGAFGAPGSSGEFGASSDAGASHGGVATSGDRRGYGPGYGSGYGAPFLWYYGGRVASGLASAGSFEPHAGTSYRSPAGYTSLGARARAFFGRGAGSPGSAARSGISRGGFGATGAAHGSGG